MIISLAAALCLAACAKGGEVEAPERGASCVLDAGEYAIRVTRGAKELEFVAPESVCGAVVRFGENGECTVDTTRSLGRASGAATEGDDGAGEYPGVTISVADGRGYRDWLVLAYPEDYAPEAARGEDGTLTFELDGASYSISPEGKCTVTRGGFIRSAIRTDE